MVKLGKGWNPYSKSKWIVIMIGWAWGTMLAVVNLAMGNTAIGIAFAVGTVILVLFAREPS